MIGRELVRTGAGVSRVNFNGGDLWDWRARGHRFTGAAAQFKPWLRKLCEREAVTAIVLFGERRPLHAAALELAAECEIDVHVIEEGALRPNSVSVEFWPAGRRWTPPQSLDDCRRRIAGARDRLPEVPVENRFWPRMREAVTYWAYAVALTPLFPRYRSHRPISSWREMLLWIRRWLRRSSERRTSQAELARLKSGAFFLFPLQLDGDAQLVHRSPFAAMQAAIEQVIADFAGNAPGDVSLLVKRHPFDPDPQGWRGIVRKIGARHGIGGRVRYVEHGDLEDMLDRCRGAVMVNSTVGALALQRGKPVHALGQAIYAIPGLVDLAPLAEFWHRPQPPADGAFALFSQVLWSECLVNGGFHSPAALDMLARGAAQRILEARL